MLRTLLASLLAAFAMAGGALAQPPLPAFDTSTPDRAIRSFWAMLDWEAGARGQFKCIHDIAEGRKLASSYTGAARKLLTGGALKNAEQKYLCSDRSIPQVFSRVIMELRMETDTRAIIESRMKNVTPIPDGVVLDDGEQERRETGVRAKYVLTKVASGWRVEQVFIWEIDWETTTPVLDDDPSNDDDHKTWVEILPQDDFKERQVATWDLTSVEAY